MVVEGLTVILAVVEPLLHEKEFPPPAVSVALAPLQIVTFPGEIEGVGSGLTFTVREADAVHPLPSVTVTE